MITVHGKMYLPNDSVQFDLRGMSSDTKPTGTFQGVKIGNSSTFLEIDTQNIVFYDEDSETWK